MMQVLFGLLLGLLSANANLDILIFAGEDRNDAGTVNDVAPLLAHPNADAARDDFISNLQGVSVEDFETFADGEEAPLTLVFPGVCTAILGSGVVQSTVKNGQHAVSGTKYFKSDSDFTVTFSEPVAAFGFYGVDIGDVQGELTLSRTTTEGHTTVVRVPHEVDGPSGGVLYFGLIDRESLFTSITFTNSEGQRDVFAFDEFVIGLLEHVEIASEAPSPQASGAPTPFELCADGILNFDETVCCCRSCGACGGCDCSELPGGENLCCPSAIALAGVPCLLTTDCGCILLETTILPIDAFDGCLR